LLCACGPKPSGSDAGEVGCATRTDVDVYAQGLQRASPNGHFSATLVSADPAPPVRGTNNWTVKLTDAQGNVAGDAPEATPFMPEHGHGTSVVPSMQKQNDGTYQVGPLYLFMPGVWRVTFSPMAGATDADSPRFLFCIDG
jgi:hypothetical protein